MIPQDLSSASLANSMEVSWLFSLTFFLRTPASAMKKRVRTTQVEMTTTVYPSIRLSIVSMDLWDMP